MESKTTEKMKAAQRRMRRAVKRLNELRNCRGALLVGLLPAVALEIESAGNDIAEAISIAKTQQVGPSDEVVQAAIQQVKTELESPQFAKALAESPVKVQMENDGWLWTETGGGCTAYLKNVPSGGYFLLTSELSAPTDANEPVELGFYDADGEYDGVVRPYPNLAAGLEAARQLKVT
jgi:hypothetical protein